MPWLIRQQIKFFDYTWGLQIDDGLDSQSLELLYCFVFSHVFCIWSCHSQKVVCDPMWINAFNGNICLFPGWTGLIFTPTSTTEHRTPLKWRKKNLHYFKAFLIAWQNVHLFFIAMHFQRFTLSFQVSFKVTGIV